MSNNSNIPTLTEFCNALVFLANLESKIKNTPIDQEFIEKVKLWSAGIFRLVVMGEVKKGKSSFINALLGVENLVPVSSDVATSTIYKICYGEKISYKVFFTQTSGKPCQVITATEVESYGTEKGNPNNEKEVDFIQIFVPSLFLKSGLVIIDTPGLGGLFKQHKRITYEYVPRADAVFMVSDSIESPIGQAELDLLEDLKKVTDQIYFVQTKAMAVGTEERLSREQNNKNTLMTHGNIPADKLNYFVVDSHLKHEADKTKDPDDLAESGFISLAMFINNNIKSSIRQNIMKNALRVILPKYSEIEAQITQMEKIYNANTLEQQNRLKENLKDAENELAQWQNSLPKLQEKFQDGIHLIKEEAQKNLQYYRPNGIYHMELEQQIFNATDMDILLKRVNEIQECLSGFFVEYEYQICKEVQAGIEQLMNDLASYNVTLNYKQVPVEYSSENDVLLANTGGLKRTIDQNTPKGLLNFENLRTGLFGGMAAVTMASLAGAAIGSVIPGIGTIIGSTAGMVIAGVLGGYKSLELKEQQELKNAKNQAGMGLSQAFTSAYQNVIDNVYKTLSNVERETFKALKNAVSSREKELKERELKIKERQMMSVKELTEEKKKLEQLKKEFSLIERVIKAVE